MIKRLIGKTLQFRVLIALSIVLVLNSAIGFAGTKPKTVTPKPYVPSRPPFGGLHLAMSADSADIIMRHIAARKNTLVVDSLKLIESDSVRIFGEPAYLQIQTVRNKVQTIVINFHPLSGDHYINTRNTITTYLERFFGRGVITQDASVTYRRWENEDGTMEVSYTDKYTRVFVRLGKK